MKTFYVLLGAVAVAGVATLVMSAKSGGPSPVVTLDPTLAPGIAAGYVMGSPDAKVEIVEYADFECPACAQFAIITEPDVRSRLVETGLVRFRFIDFPLPMHPNAVSAHVAAGCAGDQDKFWQMHDRIFQGQNVWNTIATNNPKKVFKEYAAQDGLDVAEWEACYDEHRPLPRIQANIEEAQKVGVGQTPSFRIGDKLLAGGLPFDVIKAYVDSASGGTSGGGL